MASLDLDSIRPDARRIDTLLALALLFDPLDVQVGEAAEANDNPRVLLDGLTEVDRAACDARLTWHRGLPLGERRRWMAHTLGRLRDKHWQLDEHTDASHVAEVLRGEPASIQKLICANLPASLAPTLRAELPLDLPDDNGDAHPAPAPEVMQIVRAAFLRRFIRLRDLPAPTHTDQLSANEIARTLRLLGVRETARACRGIAAVEAVASFLRRFETVDARAIAAHIATLGDVDSARIRIAEQLLQRMMDSETNSSNLLDRTGFHIFAEALAARDDLNVRYAAQKLPRPIASELISITEDCRRQSSAGSLEERREEVEIVALEVRRVTAKLKRSPASPVVAGTQKQSSNGIAEVAGNTGESTTPPTPTPPTPTTNIT